MGAYRGDARAASRRTRPRSLGDRATRSTRMRYGLGMRYDFTKSFGIRAELERYSPLGSSAARRESDADQVSVGLSWRF